MNQWQVATAAEAISAAQFARCGWDISVQYGPNQPEYDLIVSNTALIMKVSAKGSQNGGWGLTQSQLKAGDYHAAADTWLERHSASTILCLVQFKGVQFDQMPRLYLATPSEVAERLRAIAGGRGHTVLREKHKWTSRAKAAGTIDQIPAKWLFTRERALLLASAA